MFLDVHNPSVFEAVVDRAQVLVSINNRELPNILSISQQQRIPAGGDTTVELSGISLSGREIALMLVNLATTDFVLTLDFVITSYFPTLFGDMPVPANLNLDIYLVPPKPTFDQNGGGFSQVSYNTNSYNLSFDNNYAVPLAGKLQVGVMKGNSLSKIGLCDPACIAPIDSGLATFIRINLGNIAGLQVFEKENITIMPAESFTLSIDNPQLRNKENSAFIMRWNPNYDITPYVIHSQMAGVESTSQGEFSSHIVEVPCPWCHYSLNVQLLVSEEQTSEMYYKLKAAYERILFLQHYDAARVSELTKLQYTPIIKRRTASPSVSCHEIIVDDDAESIEDCVCCSSSCSGEKEKEDESHCPT